MRRRVVQYLFLVALLTPGHSVAQLWGDPPDISEHFKALENVYFSAARLTNFDPSTGAGLLQWDRYTRQVNLSFNKVDVAFSRAESNEFPGTEYERDPQLPFEITFVTPRTVRLRFSTSSDPLPGGSSLMLDGPVGLDSTWQRSETGNQIGYRSAFGSVLITRDPWRIEFQDATGRVVTRTRAMGEPATYSTPTPFSFARRASDMGRSTAAAFELRHDEKLFGGGESFTRLNKRGQKLDFFIRDAMGAQTDLMYKPIPFFLSDQGYGMFVHTSAPVTMDFGHDFDESQVIYSGDEVMDLFVFLGTPKEVLSEYTALTGRSPVPPLWSFGLWMSRITYKSESEVRDVATNLRSYKVPTDVIHLDTGWFETDWRSNYKFSTSRFDDPPQMISDLRAMGFQVSLWQLPYFTRQNSVFPEAVGAGYHVRNEGGRLPELDATLDFSNPEAVKWYQDKLRGLLDLGVGVIKADFGEGAPLHGLYASGRTGWYEHNLYPLRYNKAVFEVTQDVTGTGIIWGRSAWAGSQRYPLHWGGDAENTNSAMAATLRAGLSMGLSGFSFWSHDIGGFVERPSRDLYSRWLPFGALTSHTRTHGAPPREPWEWDEEMVSEFQRAIGLKYTLMPYVYAQARESSLKGYPMMRTLFFEYPDDPTAWLVEDEYFFGSDLLVAPLFEEALGRTVYLPPGIWFDYQSGEAFEGGRWHEMTAGPIPVILLVRDHAVIPHIGLAQNTAEMDWSSIELRRFASDGKDATGMFALPDGDLLGLAVTRRNRLVDDPLRGRVEWRVTRGGR